MPFLRDDPTIMGAARNVRLLLTDCDGVLTDGRLYFGAAGEELKVFDVRDGLGIVEWHKAGGTTGIISGRTSPIVDRRAAELGIVTVIQGCADKVLAAETICASAGVLTAETAYIGDDLPDIELISTVGFGVAVADSPEPVRAAAKYVTVAPGGRGAVREVVDILLAARA